MGLHDLGRFRTCQLVYVLVAPQYPHSRARSIHTHAYVTNTHTHAYPSRVFPTHQHPPREAFEFSFQGPTCTKKPHPFQRHTPPVYDVSYELFQGVISPSHANMTPCYRSILTPLQPRGQARPRMGAGVVYVQYSGYMRMTLILLP